MDKDQLKIRTIEKIDIIDPIPESPDPTTFVSVKTGRGKLQKGWQVRPPLSIKFEFLFINFIQKGTVDNCMCAYKLITVNFSYFGIQGRMENFILSVRFYINYIFTLSSSF